MVSAALRDESPKPDLCGFVAQPTFITWLVIKLAMNKKSISDGKLRKIRLGKMAHANSPNA